MRPSPLRAAEVAEQWWAPLWDVQSVLVLKAAGERQLH
jgi:hypothetical protein